MDDLTEIRDKAIALVLEREEELLGMQDRIQTVIDCAGADFSRRVKELEQSYAGREGATADEFMGEYRQIEESVRAQAQAELDRIIAETAS